MSDQLAVNRGNEIYKSIVRVEAREGRLSPFRRERQMDRLEERLAKDLAGGRRLRILDACCARGRLMHFLNEFNGDQEYVGFDYLEELVEEANAHFKDVPNVTVVHADIYRLSERWGKEFDISILYKTLLNFPRYEDALEQLFAVTREKVYLTSIFYEGNADFDIRIHKYAVYESATDYAHYNCYGIPRFTDFCRARGAREVLFHDLKLDFDLPKADNPDIVATHTERLANGERLELTGPVLMDWKLVEITL